MSQDCTLTCPNGSVLNEGSTLNNGSCSFMCTGTPPANATICENDDKGLTANTPSEVVDFCGAAKCEYTCSEGYMLQEGVCVEREGCRENKDCTEDEMCKGYEEEVKGVSPEKPGTCTNKYINPAFYYVDPTITTGLAFVEWFNNYVYNFPTAVSDLVGIREAVIGALQTNFPFPTLPGISTLEAALAAHCPKGFIDQTNFKLEAYENLPAYGSTGAAWLTGHLWDAECILMGINLTYYGGITECVTLDENNQWQIMSGTQQVGHLMGGYGKSNAYFLQKAWTNWTSNKTMENAFGNGLNRRVHSMRSRANS